MKEKPCTCILGAEKNDEPLTFVARYVPNPLERYSTLFGPKCGNSRYSFLIDREEMERMELVGAPGLIYTFRLRIGEWFDKSRLSHEESALLSSALHHRFSLCSFMTHCSVDEIVSVSVTEDLPDAE